MDPDKLSAAHKKISAIDGISEQGAVPDPEVMNTLFAKFIAIVGPVGILPIIFAVNSVTVGVNFAAATMGAREDFEAAAAGNDSLTKTSGRTTEQSCLGPPV